MQRSSHRLSGTATILALVATLALGLVPTAALGDDGGAQERAATARAIEELDPAIRAALIARTSKTPTAPAIVGVIPATSGSYSGGPDRRYAALAYPESDTTAPASGAGAVGGADRPDAPPVTEDGFAWRAAALGLAVGIAGMFLGLGCVTLARQHGRLRSA